MKILFKFNKKICNLYEIKYQIQIIQLFISLVMDSNEENIIQKIETDEFYKAFLQSQTKSALAHSLTITDQVRRLGEGIESLNLELQKQVLQKHDALLQQASHATKLESVLSTMNTHVQNLFANAERLKTQITVPYNELEKHTKVLERLHLASHVLRQVNRLQQLSKRLTSTNDPVQKATILQEAIGLRYRVKRYRCCNYRTCNIRAHQQKIKLATGSLNQGIINENVTQTTTALQIFINLGSIISTIDNLIEQNIHECREILKTAFDTNLSGV
ncbi:hypothetical protein NQ317_014826 [Molorchus minor]|uniref:Conserved oligomeric Golgi complex subunit 5 n=1 Tax=Molorchus minor TaxID=1323400 RepID=A0ABQ9ISP3_9CUCU|nr:hypothetical protein NQ317_014826 [Molorchus minor]